MWLGRTIGNCANDLHHRPVLFFVVVVSVLLFGNTYLERRETEDCCWTLKENNHHFEQRLVLEEKMMGEKQPWFFLFLSYIRGNNSIYIVCRKYICRARWVDFITIRFEHVASFYVPTDIQYKRCANQPPIPCKGSKHQVQVPKGGLLLKQKMSIQQGSWL